MKIQYRMVGKIVSVTTLCMCGSFLPYYYYVFFYLLLCHHQATHCR